MLHCTDRAASSASWPLIPTASPDPPAADASALPSDDGLDDDVAGSAGAEERMEACRVPAEYCIYICVSSEHGNYTW